MNAIVLLLVLPLAMPPAAPAKAAPAVVGQPAPSGPAALRRAVVSVRITGQEYDFKAPWSKHSPWTRYATGLVVPGNRILIAGNNLGNHTLIEVQRLGEEKRYVATVRLVDYEAPLAVLDVQDPTFFNPLAPLPLAREVPADGEVTVHRWLGSNQFESARAFVRQVRAEDHGFARVEQLTLDMTSTMQAGGFSEVVVYGGEVVGLTTTKREDVLLALAAPVLRQFLVAATLNPYPGFARHGFTWQKLLSPALREHLGLKSDEGGILVDRVLPHGSAAGTLQPLDVVLSIGGTPVDVSGQFQHARYGKLFFGLLLTMGRHPGESVDVRIVRARRRITVKMPLKRMLPEQDRVLSYIVDQPPDYVVKGGLVFQNLSFQYLTTYGDWRRRAPMRLIIEQELNGSFPTPERPRVVVLTHVLPDAANLGYQDERDLIVSAINGKAVGTLDDVRTAFETPAASPRGAFHIIELSPGQGSARIVLDAKEVEAATERVRTLYGVEAP